MKPYISIVVTTRNDNHGGDLIVRTSAFMKSVFYQAERTQLPVELIIVEWNPPTDKPFLKDVLPIPEKNGFVSLKYVIVPPEIHQTYKTSGSIPLYQMTAKNVGIRRSSSDFILCTNIDIIFSNECFDFFKQKTLKQNVFYRTNRCDIPSQAISYKEASEVLQFAKKNIIKRFGKTKKMETLHLPEWFYNFPNFCRILNYTILILWKWTHPNQKPHFTLDFEACGDFTLMSKNDWNKISGYPELDMYSIHIDSMGLWAAYAVGMEQEILPHKAPVYHIDHEDGWESKDAVKTIKFLESKPCLDYSIVNRAGLQIIKQQSSWGINDKNWGMNDKKLQEFVF